MDRIVLLITQLLTSPTPTVSLSTDSEDEEIQESFIYVNQQTLSFRKSNKVEDEGSCDESEIDGGNETEDGKEGDHSGGFDNSLSVQSVDKQDDTDDIIEGNEPVHSNYLDCITCFHVYSIVLHYVLLCGILYLNFHSKLYQN